MKETPIIFSTPMVKAILDGHKTQTRRIIKPNPDKILWDMFNPRNQKACIYQGEWRNKKVFKPIKCPYGGHGDLLWVRETFWPRPERSHRDMIEGADTWPAIVYQADDPDNKDLVEWGWKKKPSIFMPKKYARIWLEIVDIRVERLQDISEIDAEREGTPNYNRKPSGVGTEDFKILWNSINKKKYPWSSNPRVWVVEFKRTDN